MGETTPVCDPQDIAELLPRAYDQPKAPVCIRNFNRVVLNRLAMPPCAEIGYCVLTALNEE